MIGIGQFGGAPKCTEQHNKNEDNNFPWSAAYFIPDAYQR